MSYTLAEAAVACGLDKSTVRSGRISGTRDDQGVWHVEPVELHRVFPPVVRTDGDSAAVPRDAPAAADIGGDHHAGAPTMSRPGATG